jgi:hypothetical protein
VTVDASTGADATLESPPTGGATDAGTSAASADTAAAMDAPPAADAGAAPPADAGAGAPTDSAGAAAPADAGAAGAGAAAGGAPADAVPATDAASGAASTDAGAAAAVTGGALKSDRIQLVGESGQTLSIGVRTPVGKHIVRQFGDDSNVWDTEQLVIERTSDGGWQIVPQAGTTNETLLNGAAITGPQPLHEGDVIAVGRAEKGISRLPLTVRGG